MTVREYLKFVYELKKVKLDMDEHINGVMDIVKITHVADRIIKNLSKGYKQRVGLAQALIGDPEVLVLDEPTVGLDPKQIIEIRNVIKELGKSRTVILSTHILQEVSAVCDRVTVINHGRIAATDTLKNLSLSLGERGKYEIQAVGSKSEVRALLEGINGIKAVTPMAEQDENECVFVVEFEEGLDLRTDIFEAFSQKGIAMVGLKSLELTLEEIFIKLTSAEILQEDEEEEEPKSIFSFFKKKNNEKSDIETTEDETAEEEETEEKEAEDNESDI